jgi:hypothetical protein
MDSLQTGGGAVAGIGAAKLLNDKVLSHLFKTPEGQEPSFWQRLAAGAGTLVVLPTLIRAFIPNQFGEKLATGAEVGSALYVIGGIQYQGKKVLPIGNMIGADEVIVETTVAGEEVIVEGYDRSPEQVESYDRTPDRTDADVTMEDGVEMEVGTEEEVVIEG